MSFSQPPFWAQRSSQVAPRAISVLVTPVVAIVSSSIAAVTVLETLTPHRFVSGDTVEVLGHFGSTPAVDGSHVVTVIDALHISIPLAVTIAGTGGTVTRTLAVEPLTLVEGKLRAGLEWVPGDARDALMAGFIAAARSKVEQDTGLALLTQTRDVYLDTLAPVVKLPSLSTPLQAVTALSSIDTAGGVNVLDPTNYVVDLAGGRIALAADGAWPSDLRPFQPWVIRIVSGWTSGALIPPLLVHAVGLLTAHYATLGRDLASRDPATEIPFGYSDAISSYVPVVVA